MKPFLVDLLHDLREKKLWPVAALLVLAVVAAPAVLLKSSSADSEPALSPPAQTAPGGAEAAAVTLATGEEVEVSDLERFEEKNPFGEGGNEAPSTGEAPTPEQLDEFLTGGGDAGQGDDAPSSGGSPSSGSPGTSGDGGQGDAGEDTPAKPVAYTYVVDVRFGRRDASARLYRNLARLDVLPRTESPLLIFLGVSPTRKSAIFLVDSSLDQRGDGRCQPNRDECTFLHLTTERGHDLHYLETPEGESYAVRLLEIRKVRTDELRAERARQARRAREARKSGSRRRAARTRRFASPVFGPDEVVER